MRGYLESVVGRWGFRVGLPWRLSAEMAGPFHPWVCAPQVDI